MNLLRPLQFCLSVAIAGSLLYTIPSNIHAQTPTPPPGGEISIPLDSLGAPLLSEFKLDYDVVFKGVQEALTNAGYEVNYASKRRNLIETSFRQIANEDNFFDEMGKYGDVPYIRSPRWTVGRTKISVNLERLDSQRIAVRVIGLLSGYEDRFTNQWHYWRSNGKIEELAMNAITSRMDTLAAKKQQKAQQ